MKTCIYCDQEKADDEFSDEHIWPDALGGDFLPPETWRTDDVCRRCNSLSGVFVDGSFIRSWIGNAERATGARDYLKPTLTAPLGVLPLDYMGIRDRDRIYGSVVRRRLRAMGIRDKPTAPASPWQNGFAERLIGSIRRECVDHIIVLDETNLRRILKSYANYYNAARTHLSVNKDAPMPRTVHAVGRIVPTPFLGGLHHLYVRV
jgi:HNH endonuclease/integrase-like protein